MFLVVLLLAATLFQSDPAGAKPLGGRLLDREAPIGGRCSAVFVAPEHEVVVEVSAGASPGKRTAVVTLGSCARRTVVLKRHRRRFRIRFEHDACPILGQPGLVVTGRIAADCNSLKLALRSPTRPRSKVVFRAVVVDESTVTTTTLPRCVPTSTLETTTTFTTTTAVTTTSAAPTTTLPRACTSFRVSSYPLRGDTWGGTVGWNDVDSLRGGDGPASVVLGPRTISDRLVLSGFGLQLPEYSRVTDVRVAIRRRVSDAAASIRVEQATIAGAGFQTDLRPKGLNPWIDPAYEVWGTDDETVEYSAGAIREPKYLNDGDLRVSLSIANDSMDVPAVAWVDAIDLIVEYVAPGWIDGPKPPAVSIDVPVVGGHPWSDPGAAIGADFSWASISLNDQDVSDALVFSGFGFATSPQVPTGVVVEMLSAGGLPSLQLRSDDRNVGAERNGYNTFQRFISLGDRCTPDYEGYYGRVGEPDDLWDGVWTAPDFEPARFGVAVSMKSPGYGNEGQINDLRVTLVYGAAPTSTRRRPSRAASVPPQLGWSGVSAVTDPDDGAAAEGGEGWLVGTGFSFGLIPSDRIEGIALTLTRRPTAFALVPPHDRGVRLVRNGRAITPARAADGDWAPTYTTVTYGGPGDLWGLEWPAANLIDPTFGFAIDVAGGGDIESARMDVYRCR